MSSKLFFATRIQLKKHKAPKNNLTCYLLNDDYGWHDCNKDIIEQTKLKN